MKYNYAKIGERIKKLRKEHKLSQDALIEQLNSKCSIGRNKLSDIENGKAGICDLDFLRGLSEVFDCDIGYILGEYDCTTKETNDICEATGLSERTIDSIKSIKASARTELSKEEFGSLPMREYFKTVRYRYMIDTIDEILANKDCWNCLTDLLFDNKRLGFSKFERVITEMGKRAYIPEVDEILDDLDDSDFITADVDSLKHDINDVKEDISAIKMLRLEKSLYAIISNLEKRRMTHEN